MKKIIFEDKQSSSKSSSENTLEKLIKHSKKFEVITVKNINGTTGHKCKCGSWLKHWENFSVKNLPSECSVSSCTQKPEDGAHVQKDDPNDRHWYIIPLCKTHNKQADELIINAFIQHVSANISETCDK